MKKSLLALAVLSAFASAASAQSSVTLYGKVDVGGVYESGATGNRHRVAIDSGVSGGSRVGFKGSEDLGGGLKANFQIETGYCADSNANPEGAFCTGGGFMGRQAHVGLSGSFGSIDLGRQYTPTFINVDTVDPFDTGLAGQINNLFYVARVRWNNSVIYSTPNMGGFNLTIGAAAGEVVGDWKAGRQEGFNASYAAGPAYIGLSYNRMESGTGLPTGPRNWELGGTWNFGVVKAHAMFQNVKDDAGIVTAGATTDSNNYMVGVSVPFGQSTILASYVNKNDKTALNHDAAQLGLGYYYALSKRTSVYGAIAHIRNKNGAFYTVGNATDTGTGNQAVNVGVVHNF